MKSHIFWEIRKVLLFIYHKINQQYAKSEISDGTNNTQSASDFPLYAMSSKNNFYFPSSLFFQQNYASVFWITYGYFFKTQYTTTSL